jgi:hypothetical protein
VLVINYYLLESEVQMKVTILDKIVNSLKTTEKCYLFGTKDNDKVVVSSLKMRKGLKHVGVFYQNEEN